MSEARMPGFYWVKWDEASDDDPRWEPAELRDDGCWLSLGDGADCHVPKIVGSIISARTGPALALRSKLDAVRCLHEALGAVPPPTLTFDSRAAGDAFVSLLRREFEQAYSAAALLVGPREMWGDTFDGNDRTVTVFGITIRWPGRDERATAHLTPHDIFSAALAGLQGNKEATFSQRADFLINELREHGFEIS